MHAGYTIFCRQRLLDSVNNINIRNSMYNEIKMTEDGDYCVIIDRVRDLDLVTNMPYLTLKLVADNNACIISIKSSLETERPIKDELSFYKLLNKINQSDTRNLCDSCSTSYDESNKTINTEAYFSFWGYEDTEEYRLLSVDSAEVVGFQDLLGQVLYRMYSVCEEIANYK